MIPLTVVALAAVAVLGWLLARKERRYEALLENHATERQGTLARFDKILQAEAKERRELYQRIQAPDVAVAQHVPDPDAPELPPLSPLDDEAMAEYELDRQNGTGDG